MISQQQATASVSVIGIVLFYVLWSMVQTGSFLPYVSEGTPAIGNVMVFLILFSLICGALCAVFGSFGVTAISWIRKRELRLESYAIFSWFIFATVLIFITLILHVFKLISLQVSLLSYAFVWGIVMYGRIKGKNRYAKYLARGSSPGKGENPLKI
ncbi:hypothetical protein IT418_03600 [bacterium]|nr:hypothetical protein [bacterium]